MPIRMGRGRSNITSAARRRTLLGLAEDGHQILDRNDVELIVGLKIDGDGPLGDEQNPVVLPDGRVVVIQRTYGNRDKDMTAQLTKIRSSAAQATVLWGTGPGQAIATKNHRQLGIKTPLYLSHASNDFNYIRLSGPAANGVLLPSSKLYVVDSLPDSDPQKPVIARFIKDYKAMYGRLPATFAGNGYDAMMMMILAIKRAGTQSDKLRDAIEATKGYVGVTAVYTYSPTDHFGAQASSVVMLTVKNAKFVLAK